MPARPALVRLPGCVPGVFSTAEGSSAEPVLAPAPGAAAPRSGSPQARQRSSPTMLSTPQLAQLTVFAVGSNSPLSSSGTSGGAASSGTSGASASAASPSAVASAPSSAPASAFGTVGI